MDRYLGVYRTKLEATNTLKSKVDPNWCNKASWDVGKGLHLQVARARKKGRDSSQDILLK
jgi:hypothetical protein